MSRFRKHLVTASMFSILVVALLLANPPASHAVPGDKDKDVRVVNTPLEPVPTAAQGTTTIAGSVSVANTPTVSFAPSAIVGINPASNVVRLANTGANPVPVVNFNDGRQPFQVGADVTQTGTNISLLDIATVPAGKRLVIEFISVQGQVPTGQHVVAVQINTITDPFGGFVHELLVNAQPAAVNGDSMFRASQQVRLYADPGSQVRAILIRSSSVGQAVYGATISGYLVDL